MISLLFRAAMSLSLSLNCNPSRRYKCGKYSNRSSLYFFLFCKGFNLKKKSFRPRQLILSNSRKLTFSIQLCLKSKYSSYYRFSTFATCLMKLWFKSNFFNYVLPLSPSIVSISLKLRTKVVKLIRLSRLVMFFILLLNRFK